MVGLLLGRVKMYLLGAAAIVAAFAMVYLKGRRDEDEKHEDEDAEAYRDTRKRIDEATGFSDADSARQFLRDRQSK